VAQHEARAAEYLTELTRTEVQEYLRPNFFANTPDILHEYLQHGGRPAFEVRLVLAATLGASYGIYSGFELCENAPCGPAPRSTSTRRSTRSRQCATGTRPGNIKELIARVNDPPGAPGAAVTTTPRFHLTDTTQLIWYSKSAPGRRPRLTS
jgi:starch synthase (maltosyl-transferring)